MLFLYLNAQANSPYFGGPHELDFATHLGCRQHVVLNLKTLKSVEASKATVVTPLILRINRDQQATVSCDAALHEVYLELINPKVVCSVE